MTTDTQIVHHFHPTYKGYWSINPALGVDYNGTPGYYQWVDYTWTPNESEDKWDIGIWKLPFGTVHYVDNDLTGTPDPAKTVTMTYQATDKVKTGQSATAIYNLTLHDQYENGKDTGLKHVRENYRNDPNADWVYAQVNNEKFNLTASQTTTWTLTITGTAGFNLPVDWTLKTLGINVQGSYAAAASASQGIQITIPTKGYGTHLLIYDVYNYYQGPVTQWDTGGYVTTSSYNLKVPDSPAGGSAYLLPYQYMPGGSGAPKL